MPKHRRRFSKGRPDDLGGQSPEDQANRAGAVGLTLDQIAGGARVRVLGVRGGRRLVHRLAALGMVPGATLTVTRPRGPAIVAIGGTSVALGSQAAVVIDVEELTE